MLPFKSRGVEEVELAFLRGELQDSRFILEVDNDSKEDSKKDSKGDSRADQKSSVKSVGRGHDGLIDHKLMEVENTGNTENSLINFDDIFSTTDNADESGNKEIEAKTTKNAKKRARLSKNGGESVSTFNSSTSSDTPQWYRTCREELLGPDVYITPTYGNTLMGLACGKPFDPADNYKITYFAPQPRAVIETVEFKDYNQVVGYGQTGRVKLYTMTKELFIPGFLERDEGEREKPGEKYPWDGISGTRPFHEFAKTTTVGVY